jgi:hypothetical protein
MKPRDLRQKLHAYQERFDAELTRAQAGRLAEHPTFPPILVVTADDRSEERIARAAVEVAEVYRHRPPLPLLLTSRWRIDDPANPHGPLGPLWRDPAGADRRRAPSPDTSEARP